MVLLTCPRCSRQVTAKAGHPARCQCGWQQATATRRDGVLGYGADAVRAEEPVIELGETQLFRPLLTLNREKVVLTRRSLHLFGRGVGVQERRSMDLRKIVGNAVARRIDWPMTGLAALLSAVGTAALVMGGGQLRHDPAIGALVMIVSVALLTTALFVWRRYGRVLMWVVYAPGQQLRMLIHPKAIDDLEAFVEQVMQTREEILTARARN